jgi:hypothetical protein
MNKRWAAAAGLPVLLLAGFLTGLAQNTSGQKKQKKSDDGPQPVMVDPGAPGRAPSDATVLFDGRDLSQWTMYDGKAPEWTVENGAMVCRTGTGDLHSRAKFRNAQIHIEFNVPPMPGKTGQQRGNSGVMLQSRTTEIQILDSVENPTYADGVCGGLYGIAAPLVNAWRGAGEWQAYDIVYHAPKCGDGDKVEKPGSLTLLRNGVLVQDAVASAPRTGCVEEGPLILQDHNGFGGKRAPSMDQLKAPVTPMRFRNVWIRHLSN